MNLGKPSARARFEEFLPLRGRWLRYFVVGGLPTLLAIWWLLDGYSSYDSLLTILSAEPNSIILRTDSPTWWPVCGGGPSMSGHTLMHLWFGPWVLAWDRPWIPSSREEIARAASPWAFALIAIALCLRRIIRSRLRRDIPNHAAEIL